MSPSAEIWTEQDTDDEKATSTETSTKNREKATQIAESLLRLPAERTPTRLSQP